MSQRSVQGSHCSSKSSFKPGWTVATAEQEVLPGQAARLSAKEKLAFHPPSCSMHLRQMYGPRAAPRSNVLCISQPKQQLQLHGCLHFCLHSCPEELQPGVAPLCPKLELLRARLSCTWQQQVSPPAAVDGDGHQVAQEQRDPNCQGSQNLQPARVASALDLALSWDLWILGQC